MASEQENMANRQQILEEIRNQPEFDLESVVFTEIKCGKCKVHECFNTEIVVCIKCGRYDTCKIHTGDIDSKIGFHCSDCVKVDADNSIIKGTSHSRIKIGKCIVKDCPDNELLNCIRCKRHDICFNHMGGNSFTRVYCKNCIKIVIAEEYIQQKELGIQQKSFFFY